MFEGDQVGLQQRHAGAAVETEVRHPVTPQDPPKHWGRTQMIGLAAFIAVPVLLYVLLERL